MADKPAPPAEKRVAVITGDGKFGTISEKHAEEVVRSGGRVLSAKEATEQKLAAEFENQTTAQKIGGVLLQGPAALSPELMATKRGAEAGFTAGLAAPLEAKAAEAIVPGAGKAMARRELDLKEAHEGAYGVGEAAGMVGSALASGGTGAAGAAAKAIPGVGISAIGGAVERGVAGRLAGLAAKGTLGRAAATAAEIGARGAVEGGAFAATQAASEQVLADPDLSAQKLFTADGLTAVGNAGLVGALTGGVGGAALGGAGSLAASGARKAFGGLARVMSRGEQAAAEVAPKALAEAPKGPSYVPHPTANPDEMATMMVNTDALENAWKKDTGFHFGPGEEGISGRRAGFQEWRAKNPEAAIEASRLTVDDTGRAVFTDGRHRFAEMRDAGTQRVGVTLPKEDLAKLGPEWMARTLEEESAHLGAMAGEQQAAKGLAKYATAEGVKGLAHDRAWGALGGGFGLQTTSFAKRAAKYLANGTRDVGEWVMRKGIINPKGTVGELAKGATPEKMLPAIVEANEVTGRRIGEITGASGGRIDRTALEQVIDSVARGPEESGATRHVGKMVRDLGNDIIDSLARNGDSSFAVQDVVRERRALDSILFDTAKVHPKLADQIKQEFRGKLEGLVVDSLDEASGRLSGELAKEYKALKKDYLIGMIAQDAAEDSAARASKAGWLGLKDLTFGGGSIIKSIGSKLVRERGDAVAAGLLYREAERGTIAKWVQKVDDQIGKASKGLLDKPSKGVRDPMPPTRALSRTALAKVAEFNADPEGYIDRVARQHESLAAHSPEIAESLTAKHVQAMTFLASKVPVSPDPDPLDPHPAPQLTAGEQAELGRYWYYVEKPSRFYAEVARGKLTYEGAEVAQALTPGAFEQLQAQTAEALTERLAKGERLPFRQRQVLGVLLDFAATPSQRPEHARFLQQNAITPEPPPPPAPRRAAPNPSQRTSSYDRLEADGPGRR